MDGYVTTPNGTLKKYNVMEAEIEILSEEMPSDPKDPLRKNNIDPTDNRSKKEKDNDPEVVMRNLEVFFKNLEQYFRKL